MRWLALVVLAACGSSAPPPAVKPATPDENRCAHVADHLLSLMTDTAREAPVEELDRVRANFNHRCVEDEWSVKAQNCFLALKTKEEVDTCATLLTPAQRGALEHPVADKTN